MWIASFSIDPLPSLDLPIHFKIERNGKEVYSGCAVLDNNMYMIEVTEPMYEGDLITVTYLLKEYEFKFGTFHSDDSPNVLGK